MKFPTKAIAFSLVFLAGAGVGFGTYHLHLLGQASAEAKQQGLICSYAHKSALRERAELFRQKLGRWPKSVGELVEAHFL
ncbi:MAG TPA: hypothetical protein VFC07_14320, partial [Verrucomicrobiae bacterium]|nr:hypothetical protein [Verrucomicrobiae bacterium]